MPSVMPAEKTDTPIADSERRTPAQPLPFDRLEIDKDKHQVWACSIDVGVTLEDLLTHTFWIHNSKRVRPYDEVKVYSDDGTWRAHLHVIDKDETGMTLDVISVTKFKRVEQMRTAEGIPVRVRSAGLGKGYKIERNDGMIISGFPTRAAAEAHLRNSAVRI